MKAWTVLVSLAMVTSTQVSGAESFSIKGSARVRAEAKSNYDFDKSANDYMDYIGSRFRLDMHFQAHPELAVLVQPQFTKYWGQQELNLTATTPAASSDITSGGTNDTLMDVHQAYIQFSPREQLQLYFGRKQLSFGDELLVGALDWNNVGRSFDVALLSWVTEKGQIDAWSASLIDANITSAGAGEKEFNGLNWAMVVGPVIKAADFYVMELSDPTSTASSFISWGGRIKAAQDRWDLRAEATHQDSQIDADQFDMEIGFMWLEHLKTRWSAEYFQSTSNFNQLFPTVHKWLGIADMFGRRNIKGYRLGLGSTLNSGWSIKMDYHWFQRFDSSAPAYALNGSTGYGSVGSDGNIAQELDLVVGKALDEQLMLEIGVAAVSPEQYLKANGKLDQMQFSYVQLKSDF